MKIVSTAQMRELDRRTIEEFRVKGETLMERAGDAVADAVRRLADHAGFSEGYIHLIAGRGNNGGDAFVAARHLKQLGFHVTVWLAGSASQIQGDALKHFGKLKPAHIPVDELPTVDDWREVMAQPYFADVIVDGVLGIGLAGPARGPAAAAIQYIRQQARASLVVAIDVPSGLDADRGVAEGDAVLADLTMTMGLPKTGLVRPSALEYVGSLEVADLGIPRELVDDVDEDAELELIHNADLWPLFARRRRDSHKGTYGRLLVIGGSAGASGAAAMAGEAALRSGTGLVTVLTAAGVAPVVGSWAPELMVHGGPETADGALARTAWAAWRERRADYTAILIGPGLGRGADARELARAVIRESAVPVVADADALSVLEGDAAFLREAAQPVVITPHPGEMARLLGTTAEAVQADRAGAARRAAEATGAVVVLKGAGTLVAAPGRPLAINLTGNPGMATAGMGDALAGMLAGWVAQGMAPADAARVAVYLHGRAGDVAALRTTQAGLTATDLIREIPYALRELCLR